MMDTKQKKPPNALKSKKSLPIIKSKFREFSQHSSLHGFYYFYSGSSGWVVVTWGVIVLASLGLCCFLSHMIWDKFDIDPTLTVVENTRYSTTDIPLPATSLCATSPVHGPKTKAITKLLTLRGYNLTQIYEFYKSFEEVKYKDYFPKPYVRKMHFHLEGLGYTYNHLLYSFMKPCDEMITECSWRSEVVNCSEMFRPVFTINGYCCQFDVQYFGTHTLTEKNLASGVQKTEALEMIVDVKNIDMYGNVSDGFVRLFNFDFKDTMSLVTNDIIITPQVYFDINIYLWIIDSSGYVKDLSLKKRKCFLENDKASSYETCLTKRMLKKVVDICRCLPFHFRDIDLNVDYSDTCGWDQLRCIHQNLAKVQENMRDVISQSGCYQRCDYVQYDAEVEFLKYQRHMKYLDETSSRISVHFSESTCIKYRREVLYSWDQMLANLGGIFGLCLGGSIISIIELVWFLFDLLFTLVANKCTINRPTKSAHKSNKINVKSTKSKNFDNVKIYAISQKGTNLKGSQVNNYMFVN